MHNIKIEILKNKWEELHCDKCDKIISKDERFICLHKMDLCKFCFGTIADELFELGQFKKS